MEIGPVVRILPYEVHLSDPENVDKIYYMGSKYCKSPVYYGAFCIPEALFATVSNEVRLLITILKIIKSNTMRRNTR